MLEIIVFGMARLIVGLVVSLFEGDDIDCNGDDGHTRLPQLRDLHLERGLLWPREAAKPIEAPSVK